MARKVIRVYIPQYTVHIFDMPPHDRCRVPPLPCVTGQISPMEAVRQSQRGLVFETRAAGWASLPGGVETGTFRSSY